MSLPLAASELLLAREQMAFTLGFHIILASMGVGFPADRAGRELVGPAEERRGRADAGPALVARRWRCCSPSAR